MQSILLWAAQHGYFALFSLLMLGIFGVPVPDETLLTFAGFLVYKDQLSLIPAIVAAFGGSMVGITLSYALGRFGGFYLIKKYGHFIHITPDKLDHVHDWFGSVGKWSLTFGYFFPGIRHLTAVIAGTSRMRLTTFMLFACIGALLWASTFILIGAFIGEKWQAVSEQIHQHLVIGTVMLIILILAFYLAHRWLGHKIINGKYK